MVFTYEICKTVDRKQFFSFYESCGNDIHGFSTAELRKDDEETTRNNVSLLTYIHCTVSFV